ncbi:ImmA/IrrE family metallo-endopeptidase [Ramlibacter humi]|nr:ImmA/IrrE family metallo-endopeptidase [Ramlibacter humi]
MSSLSVSVEMLRWAAEKLGTSIQGLATDYAAPSRTDKFVRGELTATQATKLASKVGIPFGYLFLDKPPAEERRSDIPDLRQLPSAEPLGSTFFDVLDDLDSKVAWFRQYLRVHDIDPPTFVGSFNVANSTPEAVAKDITKTLRLDSAEHRQGGQTSEELFNFLAARLESVGVLVFRSGVAKGNPHRPLPLTEFRGFAVADEEVPVVFINGRDSPAAWVFTLIHEAAHIWIGQSGISDVSASTRNRYKGTEAFCNQVAAEVLTPEREFRALWKQHSPEDSIVFLARHFGVSRLVVARRALDFALIEQDTYDAVAAASTVTRKSSGGNPYATIPIRSSRRFTSAVVNSAIAGETLLREAARLLNSTPNTVVELHRRHSEQNPEEGALDA